MDKKDELRLMIEHPEYIMHAEKQSLDARINQKQLDSNDKVKAVADTAKDSAKSLASDVLSGKWGDLVFDVIDSGSRLKDKLEDMKKALLFAEYLQKTDDVETGLKKLTGLITDPYGLSIYSKISNLLEDTPADDEMLEMLSDYLVRLTDEDDLEKIFSQTKSILTLIDKSSPQALVLLRNFGVWPLIPMPDSSITVGGHIQGDNSKLVATEFAKIPIFADLSVTSIQMAIVDLETNRLAEFISGTVPGMVDNQGNLKTVAAERPTDTGNLVLNAIKKTR